MGISRNGNKLRLTGKDAVKSGKGYATSVPAPVFGNAQGNTFDFSSNPFTPFEPEKVIGNYSAMDLVSMGLTPEDITRIQNTPPAKDQKKLTPETAVVHKVNQDGLQKTIEVYGGVVTVNSLAKDLKEKSWYRSEAKGDDRITELSSKNAQETILLAKAIKVAYYDEQKKKRYLDESELLWNEKIVKHADNVLSYGDRGSYQTVPLEKGPDGEWYIHTDVHEMLRYAEALTDNELKNPNSSAKSQREYAETTAQGLNQFQYNPASQNARWDGNFTKPSAKLQEARLETTLAEKAYRDAETAYYSSFTGKLMERLGFDGPTKKIKKLKGEYEMKKNAQNAWEARG